MERKQNGFSTIVVLTVVLLVVAGIFLLKQKGGMPRYKPNTSAIQNSTNLDTLSTDLDITNPDEMDTELNQLNSDSSSF